MYFNINIVVMNYLLCFILMNCFIGVDKCLSFFLSFFVTDTSSTVSSIDGQLAFYTKDVDKDNVKILQVNRESLCKEH